MKLYNFTPAANAQRIQMFLIEKNIEIETIQLNVREDEIFKEPLVVLTFVAYSAKFLGITVLRGSLGRLLTHR